MTYTEKNRLLGRVMGMIFISLIAILIATKQIDRNGYLLILFLAFLPRLILAIIRMFPWSKTFLIHPINFLTYSETQSLKFRLSRKDTFSKLMEIAQEENWVLIHSDKNHDVLQIRSANTPLGSNLYFTLFDLDTETKVQIDWVDFSIWGSSQYRDSQITKFINQFEETLVI